jgi:aspartate aminotransferase-like enzyme
VKQYSIPFVPGPVSVPEPVRQAYLVDYGSGDIEPEFARLYRDVEAQLQQIAGTRNRVTIMSGEGMLALWGALKSVLRPGERVVAVATGLFGYGIGEMAESVGGEVTTIGFEYDETIHDWERVRRVLREVRPSLVTAVHCETPSGTLNPVGRLGKLIEEELGDDCLLYVDAVASLGGAPVEVDDARIDLALFATQKALSAQPGLAMVAVSERAWAKVEEVAYQGYDALLPWREVGEVESFPYTPPWASVAALGEACRLLLDEGLERVYARHERVAEQIRQGLQAMGISLYPGNGRRSTGRCGSMALPWAATGASSTAKSSGQGTWARRPTRRWRHARSASSSAFCGSAGRRLLFAVQQSARGAIRVDLARRDALDVLVIGRSDPLAQPAE